MIQSTPFPLYVFEKDDWTMFLVESPDTVLRHIEPFDFENDEYLFWDANGNGVRLALNRGELTHIEQVNNEISLHEAFARYSQALGGVSVDTTGTFAEAWARLESSVKPQSRLSRALQNTIGVGCSLIVLAVVIFLLMFLGFAIKAIFGH